jgi:hypothetical protein
MFLNVDIEESSISNHPDIEVETSTSTFLQYRGTSISKYKTSISTFLQYRGTSISKFTNDNIDTYSFDIEVAYRTRYRHHKSKRRYRRFMMPISAYTDIGYKTSISTSWQGSRCGSAPGADALFCRCMSSACQLPVTVVSRHGRACHWHS